MAIVEHPKAFLPKSDYSIVKYLDLTKYISLLQRQALFFCRLDKLEDPFEGLTPKANFDPRVEWHRYMRDVENFYEAPPTDDEILQSVKRSYEDEKFFKMIYCVNCWNKYDQESAALWKIYSDFNKGIMIRSSINNIKRSLTDFKEEITLSEVKYLNYDKDIMSDGNIIYPIIHKQKAYSYENEVRLIFDVTQPGRVHDWSKEEIEEGLFIGVDLDKLIDEIIISPYASEWFTKLIVDLTNKYGLKKNVKRSALSWSD